MIPSCRSNNKSICVVYNFEFVWVLKHLYNIDVSEVVIWTDEFSEFHNGKASKIGCIYLWGELEDMKFDVTVGNPPFSNNKDMLYPRFFQLSLENSKEVAMIMPENLNVNWRYFINHNKLVKTHSREMMDVTSHFGVGISSMHCVFASRDINNKVEPIKDKFEGYNVLYPEKKRLKCIKGGFPTTSGIVTENGDIEVITKVHKTGPVIEKYDRKQVNSVRKLERLIYKGNKPWLCIVNHTPSRGKFNTYICESKNKMWSGFVFAIECNSKKEAEEMSKWLTSDAITNENIRLLETNKTYATSKTLIEKLPDFRD